MSVTETVAQSEESLGRGPRIGLVLGAGGVAGIAYHAGILAALSEALGWDPRTADVVVGTSAGSVTAAGLRAGLSAGDVFARCVGTPLTPEGAAVLATADAAVDGRDFLSDQARFTLVPAALRVVWAAGRRPGRVRPGAVLAGLLPPGRVSTSVIADSVAAMFPDGWPSRPTWICAVHLDDGVLTEFGRHGAPPAGMGQAVAASCAIPGYFTPVPIGGVRYVDGGAHSTSNLATVADEDLDLVVVSAPMARAGARPSFPDGIPAALGAAGRELNRLQLQLEARRLRARGTEVVAFSPTLQDRSVMGLNPMDPARREPIARQARRSALTRLARPDVAERLAPLGAGARRQPA